MRYIGAMSSGTPSSITALSSAVSAIIERSRREIGRGRLDVEFELVTKEGCNEMQDH